MALLWAPLVWYRGVSCLIRVYPIGAGSSMRCPHLCSDIRAVDSGDCRIDGLKRYEMVTHNLTAPARKMADAVPEYRYMAAPMAVPAQKQKIYVSRLSRAMETSTLSLSLVPSKDVSRMQLTTAPTALE